MEIEWNIAGIAVVLWGAFLGLSLYVPKTMGTVSWLDFLGIPKFIITYLLLLPLSYFIVYYFDNK